MNNAPSYLKDYDTLWEKNPHKANIKWFKNAAWGLFIHYGLYSLLGRGEWVQYHNKIPIAEYAKLKDRFTAEKFDAESIVELAIAAEMKYVNLVCKHCDSFYLWDTEYTTFNSVNSSAGRDLVKELADACRKRGLGFFTFYEHGFDWRHAHAPAPWEWPIGTIRPHYNPPDSFYAPPATYDFEKYLNYVSNQIAELCSNYGRLAGVWLDGAAVPVSGNKKRFKLQELYTLIKQLQPQALISYKFGVEEEGEDFLAPEEGQLRRVASTRATFAKINFMPRNGRPMEICSTMQKGAWGYDADAEHVSSEEVWGKLEFAASNQANLLLNIGPRPDGSVHPEDVKVLKEVGHRIRDQDQ